MDVLASVRTLDLDSAGFISGNPGGKIEKKNIAETQNGHAYILAGYTSRLLISSRGWATLEVLPCIENGCMW